MIAHSSTCQEIIQPLHLLLDTAEFNLVCIHKELRDDSTRYPS
jgi:hypothetical protein